MTVSATFQSIIAGSLKSALRSSLLIIKLVVPLYILADILLYFDLLRYITFLFTPITGVLHLPPEAAIALAAGLLINIYAAIAFAAPLGLDPMQWTILAVFLGVSHALPIECAVMARLGIAYAYSCLLRLVMAFITVWPVLYMPRSWFAAEAGQTEMALVRHEHVLDMLLVSCGNALVLSLKIILLIGLIILVMDLIRATPMVQRYTEKVNTAFSIIAGQLLGITYGAGILIREVSEGRLTRQDIFFVGTFLMVCHSIIEDVLLFVLFGANYWVVVIVRVLSAVVASYGLLLLFRRWLPLSWVVRSRSLDAVAKQRPADGN